MDALLEELIKCVFEGAFDISFFFSPSDSSVAALQRATLWHTDTPAEAVCVVRQDRSKGLNAAGPESPSGKARLREAWGGLLQRAAKDEVATAKAGEEEEEEEGGGRLALAQKDTRHATTNIGLPVWADGRKNLIHLNAIRLVGEKEKE